MILKTNNPERMLLKSEGRRTHVVVFIDDIKPALLVSLMSVWEYDEILFLIGSTFAARTWI